MPDALIPHDSLAAFTTACLEKIGVPAADARLVADTLVASNLRGVESHGVMRLPHYALRLRNGSIRPRPNISFERTGPSTGMVEGGAGMGQVVAARAMREAIALARESGVGAVGARNSSHCGACAYYVEMALRDGLVGVAMTHADPIMVPTGMTRPFLGSNPIAFGAPGLDGPPIVMDMATTNVALGKILLARQEGRPIPADWAVDQDGRPTTDPHQVIGLLPLAGPKGYALAVMIEVCCAFLTGVPHGTHMCRMYGDLERPRNLGHFMLAIDIARFGDPREFRRRIDQFVREIHTAAPADPDQPPLAPGEPEQLRAAERRRTGVPLGPGVLGDLIELASALGVPPLVI